MADGPGLLLDFQEVSSRFCFQFRFSVSKPKMPKLTIAERQLAKGNWLSGIPGKHVHVRSLTIGGSAMQKWMWYFVVLWYPQHDFKEVFRSKFNPVNLTNRFHMISPPKSHTLRFSPDKSHDARAEWCWRFGCNRGGVLRYVSGTLCFICNVFLPFSNFGSILEMWRVGLTAKGKALFFLNTPESDFCWSDLFKHCRTEVSKSGLTAWLNVIKVRFYKARTNDNIDMVQWQAPDLPKMFLLLLSMSVELFSSLEFWHLTSRLSTDWTRISLQCPFLVTQQSFALHVEVKGSENKISRYFSMTCSTCSKSGGIFCFAGGKASKLHFRRWKGFARKSGKVGCSENSELENGSLNRKHSHHRMDGSICSTLYNVMHCASCF